MNKLITLILLSTSAMSALAAPELKEAAKDVCKCMEQPNKVAAEVTEQIKKAQAAGNPSKIMEYQDKAMNVMEAAAQCFEELPKKYPEIDKSEELKKKVMNLADETCPNEAKQFML